jgi:hypothetical protein
MAFASGNKNFLLVLSLHLRQARQNAIVRVSIGGGVPEFGRRARLRIWCSNAWGFESPLPHLGYQQAEFLPFPSAYRPEAPDAGVFVLLETTITYVIIILVRLGAPTDHRATAGVKQYTIEQIKTGGRYVDAPLGQPKPLQVYQCFKQNKN